MGLYYGLDFNFDMEGLGITGHNIRKLILNPEQLSEFSDRNITVKEIEDILKTWEYFESFSGNGVELSIAMRYPVMARDNLATIKNYEDFDADVYINMGNKILVKTSLVYIKFIENELIDNKKRLRPAINFLKNKVLEFDED